MILSKLSPLTSQRAICDNSIIQKILPQLKKDQIFVDTSWLEVEYLKKLNLHSGATAVCYSGVDWENTKCVDRRLHAHRYIVEHTKNQIHIGNSNGSNYFNWWIEFIRQNSTYFFDERYINTPDCEYLYMCLNRKAHEHRLLLLNLLKSKNLLANGIVSHPDLPIDESLIFVPNDGDGENNSSRINDIFSLGDPQLWNKHFINVVTETVIHTDVMISEKTWKPIIGLRPFLVLGDYTLYKKLHEFGIDTFDDVFGQWYLEPSWEKRADAITDILLNFEKNTSLLNQLWLDLKTRLLSNRQQFIDLQFINLTKISNLSL